MPARAPQAADVLHSAGIYRAVGASAAEAAKVIDPRLKWEAIEGQIDMVEAQRISDQQPHAVSLRALAGRAERREKLFVSPWRVIEVLLDNPRARVSDLDHPAVPGWLAELVRIAPPDVGPRACVTVTADDQVVPSPAGTQAAW